MLQTGLRLAGTRQELEGLVASTTEWQPVGAEGGAEILNAVAAFIRRFVVMQLHQAEALALWIAHTYTFEQANATPYMHITSPEKRSGKTRLLEVLELLVHNPWLTGRATAAVLVRKIDRETPPLLLDETDAAFKGPQEYAETLRAILNTGFQRGGVASLCVGQGANITYKDFSTFCPKAIAGIGRLPDTVEDRCIAIILKRRLPSEPIERFRRRKVEPEAGSLRQRLMAWVMAVKLPTDPELPQQLDDRACDSWEPLLAIADAAGGDWPRRARAAALTLSGRASRDDPSLGVQLLSDIRKVFEARGAERLSSKDLVEELVALGEAPWGDIERRPLDVRGLARLLRPFGIKPHVMRLGDATVRGYDASSFEDVWNRYIPLSNGDLSVTSVTLASAQILGSKRNTDSGTEANVTCNTQIRASFNVTDVTDKTGGKEEGATNRAPRPLPANKTQTMRDRLLAWGEQQGRPGGVPLGRGESIAPGDAAWRKFAEVAPEGDMTTATVSAGLTRVRRKPPPGDDAQGTKWKGEL